jgi:hypothetical protein
LNFDGETSFVAVSQAAKGSKRAYELESICTSKLRAMRELLSKRASSERTSQSLKSNSCLLFF